MMPKPGIGRVVTLLTFFILPLCLIWPSQADDHSPSLLFSDPDRGVTKPDQWVKAPIQYDQWAKEADIAATLDQHLYPAFLPFIQSFAKQHDWDIAVREGTCGTSEGLLNRKQVDMGGFCCPPAFTDRLPGLRFHTMGIASLAILVHPDNPVTDLTAAQVRDIFRGIIRNWNEIEVAPGKKPLNLSIRPVGRLHCKIRPGHWRSILDDEDQFSPALVEVGTIPSMISVVSDYKGTIGYEVLWNLTRFKERGQPKAVTIDGVSPYDKEATASGRYPFYRVDNVTTWETPGLKNDKAKKLVGFLMEKSREVGADFVLVPAEDLRKNGWKFKGNELIGEP
ncbi:MAG: substrate-binding domain-containing protein [Magnetococcales bacterium]|nr:substrate-binding domain-containing protein [Magnetococcales bacterium]